MHLSDGAISAGRKQTDSRGRSKPRSSTGEAGCLARYSQNARSRGTVFIGSRELPFELTLRLGESLGLPTLSAAYSYSCTTRNYGHMTGAAKTLVQRVWNYAHVLKDDGLAFMDYTEQITYLLFLKMAWE